MREEIKRLTIAQRIVVHEKTTSGLNKIATYCIQITTRISYAQFRDFAAFMTSRQRNSPVKPYSSISYKLTQYSKR